MMQRYDVEKKGPQSQAQSNVASKNSASRRENLARGSSHVSNGQHANQNASIVIPALPFWREKSTRLFTLGKVTFADPDGPGIQFRDCHLQAS